jgi:hypothetical protein
LILSIFLEKTTKKDNKNSSIPSSQTGKDESSLDHQGSNGKGKKENDALAKNTRVHEQVTVLSQIFIKCKAALICGHSYPAKAINCL